MSCGCGERHQPHTPTAATTPTMPQRGPPTPDQADERRVQEASYIRNFIEPANLERSGRLVHRHEHSPFSHNVTVPRRARVAQLHPRFPRKPQLIECKCRQALLLLCSLQASLSGQKGTITVNKYDYVHGAWAKLPSTSLCDLCLMTPLWTVPMSRQELFL